jgi:SulP family sulfate permease
VTLALCLLFLTGLLASLPKAVLAAVVLTAVAGLIDVREMVRLFRVSRVDFAAAAIALVGVLLLGILQGILLAALASVLILLARASRLHVAFLGRMAGTGILSDMDRHPENAEISGILAFRPEGSLLYLNAESVQEIVLDRIAAQPSGVIRLVVCDLSSSPVMDLAGVRMLRKLQSVCTAQGIRFAVAGPHGRVRDLLRREGFAEVLGGITRFETLDAVIAKAEAEMRR